MKKWNLKFKLLEMIGTYSRIECKFIVLLLTYSRSNFILCEMLISIFFSNHLFSLICLKCLCFSSEKKNLSLPFTGENCIRFF